MPPPVITGFGLITSLGTTPDDHWPPLLAGTSGLRPLSSIPSLSQRLGGEAPPLDDPTDDRRARARRYTHTAALHAWTHAGLPPDGAPNPPRAALVLGSSLAAHASAPAFWTARTGPHPERADPADLQSDDPERQLAEFAHTFNLQAGASLVANACAAGASALGQARAQLLLGHADVVLALGVDALDLHTLAGFGAIRALSPDTIRPFAHDRAGMQLGDGFAAFVLETADHARARGAQPLALLRGVGESADAHHLTQPHPDGDGAVLAMRRALTSAALEPDAIDYVNVHATATPSNDLAEARALATVFGPRLARLPVGASKPNVGHTLGGAGAVEAAITLLALLHQTLPPTAVLAELDPEVPIPLDRIPTARPAKLRHAMSNSFGFGGCNASLVLSTP